MRINDLRSWWKKIPEGKIIAIAVGLAVLAAMMMIIEKIAMLP